MSMRSFKRGIARANMERLGIQHINRKRYGGRSFFALFWRQYLGGGNGKR